MHHTERNPGRLRDITRGYPGDTLFLREADGGLDKVGSSFFDAQSGGHGSELSRKDAISQFAHCKVGALGVAAC